MKISKRKSFNLKIEETTTMKRQQPFQSNGKIVQKSTNWNERKRVKTLRLERRKAKAFRAQSYKIIYICAHNKKDEVKNDRELGKVSSF